MIAYLHVSNTNRDHTFRIDLENHTDTLRVSELYTLNTGMDGDRYPDYTSEHEIISSMIAGVTTMKGLITQAKVASRTLYDEETDEYSAPVRWKANFRLYNRILNFSELDDNSPALPDESLLYPQVPVSEAEDVEDLDDLDLPEPPEEIEVETDEDSDPIGDSGPEPGELLIIPPDIGTDSKPWGEWVRATNPGCFEPALHFNKPIYLCGDDGFGAPICNVDLAYKFKNLGDNPNLLNSCPEAFEELRADLGISYYFENKNETSE